jgi:uncharacterized membrane protein (UPF0127 family)
LTPVFPDVGTFPPAPLRARRGDRVLLERVAVANTYFARARGLLGLDTLPAGEGLLIDPCDAIHTLAMRFAIDAVFLDKAGRVTRIYRSLAPWCPAAPGGEGACRVLESAAGQMPEDLQPGDLITFG